MAMNLFDVTGKIVLITGAGTGLGAGYAKTFGKAGAVVCCAGRTMGRLNETVAAIEAEGGKAKAFQADVTDHESIKALVKAVVDEYGRLDVLVNNAGYENIQPFLEVTPDVYDDIMSINMKGAFFVAQEAARAMKESGGGKIINIGSLGSYIGLAESSVYCSTKGGIIQMTKTMAIELGEFNIQVNALAPGYFITPMTQPFYDDPKHRAWIESRIPLHQWGTDEDLAGPVLFLASAASNYVTGVTIKVDGGWLAS